MVIVSKLRIALENLGSNIHQGTSKEHSMRKIRFSAPAAVTAIVVAAAGAAAVLPGYAPASPAAHAAKSVKFSGK
jgi:hypothetical protein